ncbi:DNA gyrase inhibitor YacG [Amphibiibacter pelophylacis]|uniref:DNA gyrase inhibitor YacG n=1 Tax=Amphibiibacter pelophylacis TaxID=1799477 RepID=A0ACC6P3E5_9BURK
MTDSAPLIVPCPRCQTPTEFARSNPWRPFCSERCKSGDLGAWASGEYALPAPPDDEDAPDAD